MMGSANNKKRLTMKNKKFSSIVVLVAIVLTASCTSFDKHGELKPVKEIHPGVLQGYMPVDAMPNSLALIPPPPMDDSSALALDKDVNLQGITLQGSARWDLAAQDADLAFPQAAGTFSCALNAPVS